MSFAELNDQRIFYTAQGKGPDVILLHNATGSTRGWRFLAPRLAEAGYRATAYDRPGFGRSSARPHWPLNYLHQDRDDLIALMNALEIESAALIGNSDGATISLLTAAAIPQRVALVVAESPHMWYEQKSLMQGFQQFQDALEKDPRFVKSMHKAHGDRADEVIRRWKGRWLDPTFYDWDERDALKQVRCPVLIIHGERDHFFPVSHSQEIHRSLKNSQLMIWPGVGHTPHLERPDPYARHVIQFLNLVRREYDLVHHPDNRSW